MSQGLKAAIGVVAGGLVLAGTVAAASPLRVGSAGIAAGSTTRGLASLPLGARSAVSAAIGVSDPSFDARKARAGYRVSGGGVAAQLDARGASVRAGGVSLSMSVAGVGRGARLAPVAAATVAASANRVSLDRAGLSEWYAAGPLGIEQGFTLSRRPAGTGPVSVSLRLAGHVQAHEDRSGTVFLTRPGHAGLSYGELSATDATGRPLRTAVQARAGSLELRVWDTGAAYPLRIDPLIQRGKKLMATGGVGGPNFGYSIALSANGRTALIGGPADNQNGQAGAAWVFTRSAGGVWTQQGAKLTGKQEVGGGGFGFSVALSANGNTALIGGENDNGTVGAAWVFTRSGTKWTQQGPKLTGSGESGHSKFGWSVALSPDGKTALIGGYMDANLVGAAWVFARSATGAWTQQGGKLVPTDETNVSFFGWSVALSANGKIAMIGGPDDNSYVGAAWVYTRSGSAWTESQKLQGTGGVGTDGNHFGASVALSTAGTTALIGGPGDNSMAGSAWIFTRSGSTWAQQGAKLTGTGTVGQANFGGHVALSGNGTTALIAGSNDNNNIGAAWVFARSGSTWSQQGPKRTGVGETGQDFFGTGVALSATGATAVIGGPADTANTGAVWAYG